MSGQGSLFEAPPAPLAAPDLGLRCYQQALREAVADVHTRARGALGCLPTGTGKTRAGGAISWDHHVRGSRVLWLAPTLVLVRQAYEDLREMGLPCAIEQAGNHVDRARLPAVTVASVATMRGSRLLAWPRDAFGLVVSDEAHRSASSAQRVIFEHFAPAKRLGLTATPDRTDGVSLLNVFDELAYEMSMLQAIEDGWLVPLKFRTAITDFDPAALRSIAGEVSAGSVEAEIMRSGLLHSAANTLADLSPEERKVAFLPTVASSRAFVAELRARGVTAEHIDAKTPEAQREELFAKFKAGDLRALSNFGVLTEGWDMPEATVIALLNPTKSRSRITQMIGRATRPAPGKTHALVIDFCAGRLRKGRLASPADALSGRMLPDNVHELLAREGDLAKAIEAAVCTADEIEQRKRESAEAAQRKRERTAELAKLANRRDYSYGVHAHDARDILGGHGNGDRGYASYDRRLSWAERKEAEKQRRRALGLCSPAQAYHLEQGGLNPDLTWQLARIALDPYFAAGKVFPQWVLEDPRFQRPKMETDDMADLAGALMAQLQSR